MKREEIVSWLEQHLPINKARGLLAQLKFVSEFKQEQGIFKKHYFKYYNGCWLLAPKNEYFYKARFCFFVYERNVKREDVEGDVLIPEAVLGEREALKFRMVAGFLVKAGLMPFYAFYADNNWLIFYYDWDKEVLKKIDPKSFFGKWPGRGRPGRNRRAWSAGLRRNYLNTSYDLLLELYLREKFYTEFIKGLYRVSVMDPYDVDAFIVGPSVLAVIPVEIKEKFPGEERGGVKYFGIDVGRILMLLRLSLPTDMNALYIIREVASDETRGFISWKYTLLSDIVMAVSWNIFGGGRGMGGQETHTAKIPYHLFKDMNETTFADKTLKEIMILPREIKKRAEEFYRYAVNAYIG